MKVSVISTGSVRIRPQHVEGTGAPVAWWLLTSRRWTEPLPINVYVIERDDGLVLFDTGQDRASVTDAGYFPRGIPGFLYSRLARFEIAAGETLTAQLASIGHDIARVHTVVLSHLHQDHIGGLPELAHAEIVVSQAEWDEVRKPLAVLGGLMRDHIDLPGLRWRRVSGDVDLFGDGTLTLLPTPGHSPGSMSLLLREEGMPLMLFVGDLTYGVELLAAERVPGIGSRRELLKSSRAVNELRARHPGLLVLAAHDPAAAGLLAEATA